MATTTSIIVLLKFFANKQKSAVVDYRDFCEYLKKYSEHHIEEQPSLSVYLEDPVPAFQAELDKYEENKEKFLKIQGYLRSDEAISLMQEYGYRSWYGGVNSDADKTFEAIAAGVNYSLAIDSDGLLWVWGKNDYGQLGLGNTNSPVNIPQQAN